MSHAHIDQQRAEASHPKIARVYLRVSTDQQDLRRQERIVEDARAAGCYIAAVYREKASGARSDRPELMRMISDRGGPVRSDSFAGLISYTRLLLCRPSDGVAVG
ncbi:hypothetical protein FOH22_00915, partial [Acetobacter tropicalis]|uniref:recombinase family protein n=3 Tax=Acetobacter tropicalis TaxID=104102 RepID=UPI001276CC30